MKKREMTTNDLEQLFNKVIEQKPLINEEQVNSLLNNLPKSPSGSTAKQFLKNHLNSLIVGTFVLSSVVVLILWVNTGHKTEKTMGQNNQQVNELMPAHADTLAGNPEAGNGKEIVQDTIQEIHSLKASSPTVRSAPGQTGTKISVSDIYKHFNKRAQLFSFPADRDTTIICKEGTSVKIKANSFISEKTGIEISGNVQIAIKEYYKISDMIVSGLSTTSGNKILETGGMLHITAKTDNENCLIKQGRDIQIGFPYSNKKDGMELFNGEWTSDKMDWKLDNTTSITNRIDEPVIMTEPEEAIFFIVEEMPEFPGGNSGLNKYISENIHYPYSAIKDKIEGKVFVSFIIDTNGLPANISVLRGITSALDKSACYLVRNMPKWKPGRQGGKPVAVSYTLPITFSAKSTELTNEEINQAKNFEKEIINLKVVYKTTKGNFKEEFENKTNDDNLNRTRVSDINRYIFSTSQLGWINCDRIYNGKGEKTDFFVQTDDSNGVKIQLVFKSMNAILPGLKKPNGFLFANVPLGEKVTLVAFKTVDDKLFLAVQETKITKNVVTDLNFRPVTMDLLKKEMEKLNKFN